MDFKDYYGMPRGKKRMSFHRTVSLALLIPINQGLFKNEQTPVVRKVDSAIHWIAQLVIVNNYWIRFSHDIMNYQNLVSVFDNTDTRF